MTVQMHSGHSGSLGALAPMRSFSRLTARHLIEAVLPLLAACLITIGAAKAADLDVMITGLGSGRVESITPGAPFACSDACNASFLDAQLLTLSAIPATGSVFLGWDVDVAGNADPTTPADCTGVTSDCVLSMNLKRQLRPRFGLLVGPGPLTDLTPAGISSYLLANPSVDTPGEFLAALPEAFRSNWIFMTRSESLQTGTSHSPRVLVFNESALNVFTFALEPHASFPQTATTKIEYMQWDAADRNFRMHEINLLPFTTMVNSNISVDDVKCSMCHSTRNVLNRSSFPGTDGLTPRSLKVKNKPNWDAYDSWGGMLPFNRDRIYMGSAEAAALRELLNPWTWRAEPGVRSLIEQLRLQPANTPSVNMIWRMRGGARDGGIRFAFDSPAPLPGQREPAPVFGPGTAPTNYSFNNQPGSGAVTTLQRDGNFVTLLAAPFPPGPPVPQNTNFEGRGVQLFDLLGGLDGQPNALRIADELINHRVFKDDLLTDPIDIRPLALAIFERCITRANIGTLGIPPAVTSFFDQRNGGDLTSVFNDTRQRMTQLPQRKADLQRFNLDNTQDLYVRRTGITPASPGTPVDPHVGLLQRYLSVINNETETGVSRFRKEVFRRTQGDGGGRPDQTVMDGLYTDREDYPNADFIAVARYFLEPLGVSVDKWSMNVRGRSRGYNFADVLDRQIRMALPELRRAVGLAPNTAANCADVNARVFGNLPAVTGTITMATLPPVSQVPSYTNVQRIFNKACIECHGGLRYPPYENVGGFVDFSENETPPPGQSRMRRSWQFANGLGAEIRTRINSNAVGCDTSAVFLADAQMPFCGPKLSGADINVIERWLVGASAYSEGDPHIRTVDGINYDFQGAGEYVLLRDEGMELQSRMWPLSTSGPLGPNGYTGLTSCVSVNTAVALRLAGDRITYIPPEKGDGGKRGPELRINGERVKLGKGEIVLPSGGRVVPVNGGQSVLMQSQGGTTVTVSPWFSQRHNVWIMDIRVDKARATAGLMGALVPGNWLPSLPDGSELGPRPADLDDRYKQLYGAFGNAWRVDASTSLFDYPSWLSWKDYADVEWPRGESPSSCSVTALPGGVPPTPPMKPIDVSKAESLCKGIRDKQRFINCVQDVSVTGEPGFARSFARAQSLEAVATTPLGDVPTPEFPKHGQILKAGDLRLTWAAPKGNVKRAGAYRLCVWPSDQLFGFRFCGKERLRETGATVSGLEPGVTYKWKVLVDYLDGSFAESRTRRFQVE